MLSLITGQIGTGKTDRCLQQYREHLLQAAESLEHGSTIWLTPTQRSGRWVLSQLLNDQIQCCFEPGVMTFDQFAETIVRRSQYPASMLKPNQRRMLTRYVVQESLAAGELRHFKNVAETSGFINLLSRFITELKREETWPERLQAVLEQQEIPAAKDIELYRLYNRYQQKLRQWDKYDAEGRFWLARSILDKGDWVAFPQIRYVVVDGFTDFTSTQYEMLVLLARQADAVDITFPFDPADEREDLFAKPRNAWKALQARATQQGIAIQRTELTSRDSPFNNVDIEGHLTIRQSLFSSLRDFEPKSRTGGVCMLAASGARVEMYEIVRRVKSLLLEGIPAREILVTTRDLIQSAALVEEVWQDAGVPYCLDVAKPVNSLSIARGMLALLSVSLQDWTYASLKSLLGLMSTTSTAHAQRSRSCLQLLRDLNLRQNRIEILTEMRSHVQRIGDQSEAAIATAELALETLVDLDEILKPFQRQRTYTEHVQQLLAVTRDLFLPTTADQHSSLSPFDSSRVLDLETLAREWDLVAGSLRDAAEFQDRLNAKSAQHVPLGGFVKWLEEQFRTAVIPARRARPGEVRIINASDARHLPIRHLFVFGLQEGSFPGSTERQPFYVEQERKQWVSQGIPLDHRALHHLDEMHFFYRLVSRPIESLTLSYSYVSAKGQPQYASPFYQSVRSLFCKQSDVETRLEQFSPVADESHLLTETDLRLQAVQATMEGNAGLLAWWRTRTGRQHQTAWTSLLAASRMNASRFETDGFTRYEGLLEQASIQHKIFQRYHDQYTFSASQLESYATCPFRFLVQRVFDIAATSAPQLATNYAKRGIIVHELLARLHDSLSTHKELLSEKYLKLLEEKFGQSFRTNQLQQVLDEIEQELLSEWGQMYETQYEEYQKLNSQEWAEPLSPQYRELAFGASAPEDDPQIPVLPPVRFGQGTKEILVEGRIDRIDVGHDGERTQFAIIDYKTGKLPSVKPEAVSRGTQLQLALYAVAVVRLNLLGPEAVPWKIGYWSLKESGFSPQLTNKRKNPPPPLEETFLESTAEQLDHLLPTLVRRLRQAEFPVFNPDDKCTEGCELATVCRVNQIRSLQQTHSKDWQPVDEQLMEETSQSTTSEKMTRED